MKTAYIAAGLFAAGLAAGASINGWRLSAKMAGIEAAHAQAVSDAQKARADEVAKALQQTAAAQAEARIIAQEALDARENASRSADAADAELVRLRDAARRYAALMRAPRNPAAAGPSETPPAAGSVQDSERIIGLLGSTIGIAAASARAVGDARVSAAACAREYELMRSACNGQ